MRGVLLWDTLSELLLPRRGFYIWRKVIISFSGIIDLFNPDYIEFLPGRRSVNKCKCVMDLQKGNVVVMTGRGRQTRTSSTRQEPREEYSLYSLYTTRYTIQWAHSTGIVYIVQITFVQQYIVCTVKGEVQQIGCKETLEIFTFRRFTKCPFLYCIYKILNKISYPCYLARGYHVVIKWSSRGHHVVPLKVIIQLPSV